MAREKSKPRAPKPEPEQPEQEQPEKVSIDLEFHFDADPASEDALHVHSIVRQLNQFRDTLLEFDYRGYSPCAIEHVFHVEFEPAEVSPQEWDEVYKAFGIEHRRRTRHPYRDIDTPTLHQQLQRLREEREDRDKED